MSADQFQLECIKRMLKCRAELMACAEKLMDAECEKRKAQARVEGFQFLLEWLRRGNALALKLGEPELSIDLPDESAQPQGVRRVGP